MDYIVRRPLKFVWNLAFGWITQDIDVGGTKVGRIALVLGEVDVQKMAVVALGQVLVLEPGDQVFLLVVRQKPSVEIRKRETNVERALVKMKFPYFIPSQSTWWVGWLVLISLDANF